LENNLFQQAKSAVSRFTNALGTSNEQDRQAAQHAIQQAYTNCSAEEQQQLQQLEQTLKQKNQLS
jgi:Sec-independent protein translocase protein TatA